MAHGQDIPCNYFRKKQIQEKKSYGYMRSKLTFLGFSGPDTTFYFMTGWHSVRNMSTTKISSFNTPSIYISISTSGSLAASTSGVRKKSEHWPTEQPNPVLTQGSLQRRLPPCSFKKNLQNLSLEGITGLEGRCGMILAHLDASLRCQIQTGPDTKDLDEDNLQNTPIYFFFLKNILAGILPKNIYNYRNLA